MKKTKKAQIGMQLFTGIVISIFMIGLIVFTFTLMGSRIEIASYETTSTNNSQNDFTLTSTGGGNNVTSCGGLPEGLITGITTIINSTSGEDIDSGNYSYSGCQLYALTETYNNTAVNITFGYSYVSNYANLEPIRDTTAEMSDVPTWFGLFILMGAMVVIILMVVLIITAIKQANVGGGMEGG